MEWTRGPTVGRGSSATVSLLTSRSSGDVFAAKSVEFSRSRSLQREQKILSTLSSPHVVGYFGYDISTENNKMLYNLLMEYVPGGTLSDHGGRLDEPTIGVYARQMVQGLEYLHSCGVAHCDVKGRNVLVGESGVKLADFGCAKWVDPEAGSGVLEDVTAAIGGTPMFMAPEAARGEEQGFPADIWALGCTIIEMATGDSPWRGVADPVSVLYRIAFSSDLPEFPDFLSDQARDFLGKCLRRNPKERWTAKQLLEHPFLGMSELHAKQITDSNSNSNSPTSILDQGIWNFIEEPETPLDATILSSCSNSPEKRIGRLSSWSGAADWTWGEDWVTIRSKIDEKGLEFIGGDGGVYHEGCRFFGTRGGSPIISLGGEELIDRFTGRNINWNNSSCTEHNWVVLSSSSLERDREETSLLAQFQFL